MRGFWGQAETPEPSACPGVAGGSPNPSQPPCSQCWSKAGGGGITGRACFTIILQQVLHSRCCARSLLHRMLFPWAGMPLVAPGMCWSSREAFPLLLAGQSPVEPALPHPIQLSLLDPNRIPKHGSRERQHQPAPAPSSLCCLAWKCWRMPRACRQVEIVFRYSWCPVLSVMPCSAERDREVWVHSLGPISTELWPGWDLHPVGLMQSSERC